MLLLSILVGVFLNVAWKWTKTLMVIILLELATTSVMASFFLISSGYSFMAILMFLFFVGEALILLSALYSALRSSGATYSSLVLS